MTTPLDVVCPLCEAGTGLRCRSQTGSGHQPKNAHKARQQKAARLDAMTPEYDANGFQFMNATAVRGRVAWHVEFRCPWCGQTHSHGGGSDRWPDGDGSRASHCHAPDAPRSYTIRVTEVTRA